MSCSSLALRVWFTIYLSSSRRKILSITFSSSSPWIVPASLIFRLGLWIILFVNWLANFFIIAFGSSPFARLVRAFSSSTCFKFSWCLRKRSKVSKASKDGSLSIYSLTRSLIRFSARSAASSLSLIFPVTISCRSSIPVSYTHLTLPPLYSV